MERYKARYVARGFNLVHGIDFNLTYSPVASITSIRLVLAIAAKYKWIIKQIDIKTAFLNGLVEEEIYINQPEGYIKKGNENLVCRLIKSIYGLKQASRNWNKEISSFLISIDFYKLQSDECLFFNKS